MKREERVTQFDKVDARYMGLPSGIVVVYHRSRYTDETSAVQDGGGLPVYVYHDGVNHFAQLG
ncbi:MAG: hypothetical protein AAGC55_11165 [Myxococcota bacterium]